MQKKKLINTSCESNVKTVFEEQVSSENVHFAGRWWSSYTYTINKQSNLNKPSSKQNLFKM